MEPVRIKYLGLFQVTKSGYLIGTLIGLCVIAVVLAMAYPTGLLPPFRWPWQPIPDQRRSGVPGWLYNHFYEFLAICLVVEILDIVVTLRNFARQEAGRRASSP